MNLSEELKTAAIVGTAQRESVWSPFDGRLGQTLARLDRTDKEKFLLSSAAVFSVWQIAGKTLGIDTQPAPDIAETETGEVLTGRLKQIFETLLDSSDKSLLPEFLRLMKRRNKIIPPELLPLTFASVYTRLHFQGTDFRARVLAVAGHRGKWLARQNPDWRWVLVEETGEELFETGKTNERVLALEFFRKNEPAGALALLQATWKTESAAERQKFLEVLRGSLCAADESFLDEVFRSDKSAEVKRNAFELLANLRDSKLQREITELFRPLLSVKKKLLVMKEIEIDFPADWPQKTADLKSIAAQVFYDKKYLGDKAKVLALGLSFINPQIWETALNLTPPEIVALAYKNEWSKALLAGFGIAALRYENEVWFSEILRYSSKSDLAASPLIAWSAQTFETIPAQNTVPLICANPDYVFTDWLLREFEYDFEASSAVLEKKQYLPAHFANRESSTGLKKITVFLPPAQIDGWIIELDKMINSKGFNDNEKKKFETAIETLKFRKDYLSEFEK